MIRAAFSEDAYRPKIYENIIPSPASLTLRKEGIFRTSNSHRETSITIMLWYTNSGTV